MPSWNIHTAHVERLLDANASQAYGLRDANAFLFGNFVPDIYAGHMVRPITRKIEYKETHLAEPLFIPFPNAQLFYIRYMLNRPTDDVVVGAWTHLLCDHYYNLRAAEFIHAIGEKPSDYNRIRKQADFDVFGRTLRIVRKVHATDALVEQCAAFPQYAIAERDVYATVRAQHDIVQKNAADHVEGTPAYRLLTAEFFSQTFAEVHAILTEALRMHAAGEDASRFGGDEPMRDVYYANTSRTDDPDQEMA